MGYSNHTKSDDDLKSNPAAIWVLNKFNPRRDPTWPARFWKHNDAIRYIVGRVAVGQATRSHKKRSSFGGVPLRRDDIWHLFGRPGMWNEVRNELLERGVLECDEIAKKGIKSKHYRLGWNYRYHGAIKVEIQNKQSAKKVESIESARDNRQCWGPEHYHADYWFKRLRVYEHQIKRFVAQRDWSPKQRQTSLKVDLIQSGLSDIMVDPYGRKHDAATNVRRAVRDHFYFEGFEGKPLVEIDIANAQPLLIAYIAAKVITGEWSIPQLQRLGQKMPEGSLFQGYMHPSKSSRNNEATTPIPKSVPNFHQSIMDELPLTPITDGLPDDLLDLLRVCESGGFYPTVSDGWGLNYEESKGKVKDRTFRFILFGRIRSRHPYWKPVVTRWPTMAYVLAEVKANDVGAMSRACQRLESSLMIAGVVERFRVEFPEIPILTIHDSVMVPREFVEIAKSVILDVFGQLGLKPALKIK